MVPWRYSVTERKGGLAASASREQSPSTGASGERSTEQSQQGPHEQIVVFNPPQEQECGIVCWNVGTLYDSQIGYKWFVVPALPQLMGPWITGNAPPAGLAQEVGFSPPGGGAQTTICLDPTKFTPGTYLIGAEVWGTQWPPQWWDPFGPMGLPVPVFTEGSVWIWSAWNAISYFPHGATTLHFAIDGKTGWDLGKVKCDAPLLLTAVDQKCLPEYRVRITRWHNNNATGPALWHPSGGWATGPLGQLDLRQIGASAGLDFVPGQCYDVQIYSRMPVNGSQWYSVGSHFCIDCCC
jgi:hypothetical protein